MKKILYVKKWGPAYDMNLAVCKEEEHAKQAEQYDIQIPAFVNERSKRIKQQRLEEQRRLLHKQRIKRQKRRKLACDIIEMIMFICWVCILTAGFWSCSVLMIILFG